MRLYVDTMPVRFLLVTGDEAVCRESTNLLGGGLTCVAVKKGLGRYSARQIPPRPGKRND